MKQSICMGLVAGGLIWALSGCQDRSQPSAGQPVEPVAENEPAELVSPPLSGLTITGVLNQITIHPPPAPLTGPVAVNSYALKLLFPKRIGLSKLKTAVQDTFLRDSQPEAMAKAQYETPLGGRIQITITDFGRPPPHLETRMGMTWLGIHIDRETDRGYERDGRMGLFRFYEAVNRSGRFGQICVLWSYRLLIEIESYRLPDVYLLQALQALNWDQLFVPQTVAGSLLIPRDAPPASR